MSFLTVRSSAPPTRRPRRQRLRASGTTLSLIAALVFAPIALFAAPAAMAADGPYSINGAVPDAGAAQLEDPEGNVKELGPLNSSTTKIGVIHNDAVPTLGLTNPNGQVDLRQAWLDTERENGKDWLYFAWERDNESGSGFIAYEFMQNAAPAACAYGTAGDASLIANCNPWANRKAGDFLILWDQQGGSRDLYLRVWSGTAPNLVLSPPGAPLDASVSQAQYSADGFRGEAAVNLTDTIFGGSTACRVFANTIPSTVTGNSDTADYKDTILQTAPPITNCTSTTVTTPKTMAGADIPAGGASIGTGVVGVRDSAVVDVQGGTATPAGSVAFHLCKLDSGLCTSGGTSVGSTNLGGSAYPATVLSPTAYVTSAGRYCWRAVFSGDTANGIPGSSDSSASECFTVNPVTPTLATTAGPDTLLGGSVSDTATLAGTVTQPADPVINLTGAAGPAAGGSITFTLYGPGNCTTVAHTTAAVPVSGNGQYVTPAPLFVPTATGTYHWVAGYTGSSPNTNPASHNTDCSDANEDVDVTSVPSSLFTNQRWVPNDSATVSAPAGSGALDGDVTFTLYPTANCTGTPVFPAATVAVSGASPQTVSTSNTTAVTASGSFSWKVSYDSDNPAQRDIGNSCHETSTLAIANGGTVSSTP